MLEVGWLILEVIDLVVILKKKKKIRLLPLFGIVFGTYVGQVGARGHGRRGRGEARGTVHVMRGRQRRHRLLRLLLLQHRRRGYGQLLLLLLLRWRQVRKGELLVLLLLLLL